MRDENDKPLPDEVANDQDSVVVAPAGLSDRPPPTALQLRGEAAAPILDLVAGAASESLKLARHAKDAGELYRVVPSKELAKGLKDGSLRYANPLKGGDKTVIVKNAKSGEIAGRADLKKAISPTKLIGPAAWQAMAMATQQHYLVEINTKLAGIEKGVTELLAQRTDEQLGELEELRQAAGRLRKDIERGNPPTEPELERYLVQTGAREHEIARAAERAVNTYGAGDCSAEQAVEAFTKAVYAMQVLGELSAVLLSMPVSSTDELQHRLDQERERLDARRARLAALARNLDLAHARWEMHHTIYERKQPVGQRLRQLNDRVPAAIKIGGARPLAAPLPDSAAEQLASLLEVERSHPESLLVEVRADGSARVAVERTTASRTSASDEPTDDVIARAVTQYGRNEWWVYGCHGPYSTREGAVKRLRTLHA